MVARSSSIAASHGSSAVDAGRQAQGIMYGMVQRQSSMLAFADAFWVMAVLFLAIMPLMFLMKRAPKSGQSAAAAGAH